MTRKPQSYCRLHRWTFWKWSALVGRIWICSDCGKEQYEREAA